MSVKGNVCIVCLVRAWTSYKHVKGRKIKTNAWLDGNKYNFKKFQSKFKLEKMDLKLTETRMEVKKLSNFPIDHTPYEWSWVFVNLIKITLYCKSSIYLHDFFYVIDKRLLPKICIYYLSWCLKTNCWV